MFCGINSYNTCFSAPFGTDTAPQSFCHSFIALPMTRCSQWRIEQCLSVPKTISERCELVKLYHINCSGPVFLTHCSTTSNNIKLVHGPLMAGLLHLVQLGGEWHAHQPKA